MTLVAMIGAGAVLLFTEKKAYILTRPNSHNRMKKDRFGIDGE